MSWWIIILLIVYTLTVFALTIWYVIKKGIALIKVIGKIGERVTNIVEADSMKNETYSFVPVYTVPLSETVDVYKTVQQQKYERKFVKRQRHERKWMEWNSFNKVTY